ncbi:MAG: hypothetical protein AAGI17_02665 [Planctomycetota bacterium]
MWWQITAVIVLLAAFALLVWSLGWSRPRGRLRCPKCWYRMEGIEPTDDGWRCPECGKLAKRERKLKKTRRRWGIATLASVMLAGSWVLWMQPVRVKHGWWAIAPTWLLLEIFPVVAVERHHGATPALHAEMNRRFGPLIVQGRGLDDARSRGDQFALIDAISNGTLLCEPGDKRWMRTFYHSRYQSQRAHRQDRNDWNSDVVGFGFPRSADQELQVALDEMIDALPVLRPRIRNRWPRSETLTIDDRIDYSNRRFPRNVGTLAKLKISDSAGSIVHVDTRENQYPGSTYIESDVLDDLALGPIQITGEVSLVIREYQL